MSNLKEVTLLLVSAIVVLIAAVPNQIELPYAIYQLVQDKTNVIMLLALCLLVSYINFPLGVMLSVLIFMVMLYSQTTEKFANQGDEANNSKNDSKDDLQSELKKLTVEMCNIDQTDTTAVAELADKIVEITNEMKNNEMKNKNSEKKNDEKNDSEKKNDEMKDSEMKDSEMKNDKMMNTKMNNDQPEDMPVDEEQFESAYDNSDEKYDDIEEPFIGKQIREQIKSRPAMNGNDFDVVGCRYDLKGNLNNEFVQGPPVANCQTYDMVSVGNVGTAFYPINP